MAGRFVSRPTSSLGVRRAGDCSLKWYAITAPGREVDAALCAAATAAADGQLRGAGAVSGASGGVGFAIVHAGADATWLLLGRWDEEILHHCTLRAELASTAFQPVEAGGPTACVWELTVHTHERNAYVRHVLDRADGPDHAAYLADVLPGAGGPTAALVAAFDAAWLAGDVDGLMALMSERPIYRASTGPGPGVDYHGVAAVRAGFERVIAAEATTPVERLPSPAEVILAGDRAVSFWSYPTTATDGSHRIVEGVDVWTIVDGKLAVKDAYRKAFPDPT
jgi:hypothetical protein